MPQTEQKTSNKSNQTSEELYNQLTGLNEEKQVELHASLFFTIDEIADFIGRSRSELHQIICFDENSPLSIAYRHGSMKTKILLRIDTKKFALAGSPAAALDMKQFLSQQIMNENA